MQRPRVDDDDIKALPPGLHLGPGLEQRALDHTAARKHDNGVLVADLLLCIVGNDLAGHIDPLRNVPVNSLDEVLLLGGLVLAVLGVGILAELGDLALEPADRVADADSLRTARLEVRDHGRDVRREVFPEHGGFGTGIVAHDILERGQNTVCPRAGSAERSRRNEDAQADNRGMQLPALEGCRRARVIRGREVREEVGGGVAGGVRARRSGGGSSNRAAVS